MLLRFSSAFIFRFRANEKKANGSKNGNQLIAIGMIRMNVQKSIRILYAIVVRKDLRGFNF